MYIYNQNDTVIVKLFINPTREALHSGAAQKCTCKSVKPFY